MRFGTFTAIVVLASAATAACSLLLPYDEYPGIAAPLADAGVGDDDDGGGPTLPDPVDGGPVTAILDGGGDAASPCPGIDRNTSTDNCGACGRRCVGGPCSNGQCQIDGLAVGGLSKVLSLDIENTPDLGDMLYVTRQSAVLQRLPADGGPVEGSLYKDTSSVQVIGNVALAPSGRSGVFAGNASVWSFRTASFTSEAPVRITSSPNIGPVLFVNALGFYGDDNGLHWAEPKAGGTVRNLGGARPVAILAFTGRIFWITVEGNVFTAPIPEAATKASNLKVDAVVTAEGTNFTSLAVTNDHVYVGTTEGLNVYAYDSTTLKASGWVLVPAQNVQAVVTDGAHVYVVDMPGNGRLLRTNLDGKELTVLASSLTPSTALTLNGDYVYFASGGSIQRTSK